MIQNYTILFDLDGTLVDTAPDLMGAHNHVMKKYGFPTKSTEEIRNLVGQGAGATAIGVSAGNVGQGADAVAIGKEAGQTSQGAMAVALGSLAGDTGQGSSAVAIGLGVAFLLNKLFD